MFERERRLLSILTRCAHRSIQALLREGVDDRRAQVGTIASIQTFGSYAANFHPHVHAIITEGVFHVGTDGEAAFERARSGVVTGSARLRTRGEGCHRPAVSWIARSWQFRMHDSWMVQLAWTILSLPPESM